MARISADGFLQEEGRLGRLDRAVTRRIVTAGGEAAVEWEKKITAEKGHTRSGQMAGSVGMTNFKEDLDGGSVEVYPLDTDSRGVRNALKAFVTNYGRGGVKNPKKMGDKFITGNMRQARDAAQAAMRAEYMKIIAEANGGG